MACGVVSGLGQRAEKVVETKVTNQLKVVIQKMVPFRVHRTLATRAATTIAAYPTPFTSEVQFQLTRPGVQQLGVYDQLGRLVTTLRSQADGSVRWQPGTGVPAGLYFARSADGGQLVRLLRSGDK